MFEVLSGCNVIGHGIFGSMASNSEPPQSPNYDNIEMEGIGSLTLPNSLKAPIERLSLFGNSKQGRIINISSAELEQGALNINNGENFPSNYRVRTKDFISVEKGLYKITCEGAKQGNLVEYEENGTLKKVWFHVHKPFPWIADFAENCKIRISLSNGTEDEQITIIPSDVKSITLQTEATPEYPQEVISTGKYDETSGKYLVDVKVTGKNLLNTESKADVSGLYKGWFIDTKDDFITVSIIDKGNGVDIGSAYFGVSGNGINAHNGVAWLVAGVGVNGNKKITTPHKYFTIFNTTMKKITDRFYVQVEAGKEMTEYEPYTEQMIQLQLDEPLRGIGEYKDDITKDGIVRNILQARIADYLQKDIYGKPGERYIFSEVPNCYINYDRKRCMSNVGFTTNKEDITYMPVPYLDKFKLGVSDDDTIETIREKVKDVVVAYTVKEPVVEAFETDLGNLQTYNGTTIVSVDSGQVETGIKLTYRKEK